MPPSSVEPRVAHARVHGGERAQLVPDVLRGVAAEVVSHRAARARRRSATSSRASPGGSSALRTRCTRRSLEVTVPSASPRVEAAGRTTSASCAVAVRKRSCTTRWSRPVSKSHGARLVGLALRGVLADHVERAQRAVLHRLEHLGQVLAVPRRDVDAPRGLEARAHGVVLEVLEPRQPVRQRAHVTAALHVVLPAQRLEPRAVAPDVRR